MLKRFLSLFLSIVMVLSAVPFQVFAEEVPETVQTEETQLLPPETEVTEPAESEPQQTEVAETEETEPEETEVEETQAEETEPEETEVEETEPEETEAEENRRPILPPESYTIVRPVTLTGTRDVRVVEVGENGELSYTDTTQTVTSTHLVPEEIRIPRLDQRAITEGDNYYEFETFADLKKLCGKSYDDRVTMFYVGSDSLTIQEDLYLPKNVTLNFYEDNGTLIIPQGVALTTEDWSSQIYVNELVINGTLISNGYMRIEKRLEINGSLVLYYDTNLSMDAQVIGMNRVENPYGWPRLEKTTYVDNVDQLLAVLETICQDSGDMYYSIYWTSDNAVLTESVTIPANVRVYFGYWNSSFTIAQGVTLELNGTGNNSLVGDVTVAGKLVNNCEELTIEKTITFTETGSYSGSGALTYSTSDPEETLEDWLFGLDLTKLEVREERYPEFNYYAWEIRDVSGLTKLAAPVNLRWDDKGTTFWTVNKPHQGHFAIVVYKEGYGEWFRNSVYFGSGDMEGEFGIPFFAWRGDPDSGTYYFTVQAEGDGNHYASSDVATSGTWTYVKPNKQLGTCVDLAWDWPTATWKPEKQADQVYDVQFLFAPTADAEPYPAGGTTGMSREFAEVYDYVIQSNGPGYYYFRVRPLSTDITKICNGTWSEMSPAYNLGGTMQGVKDQLGNISNKADDEEIRDSVQSLDTEELKSAMLADKGSDGVMEQLEKLENAVGGAAPVQVNDEAAAFDPDKISIVGANLNDAAENSADPITLVLDKPQEEHILEEAYDNSVAVRFSMTLDNAADAENLEVPVKITLPVPANINPDFLVILHYKQNGQVEELTLGDVHVYRQGNEYYASFVLTSFSDFILTNYADNTVAEGETGKVAWKVTQWGKLVLSGEGSTENYSEWEEAPWKEYADQITQVEVEPGITRIGLRVFDDLDLVTEITIPEGVTFIQSYAFFGCDNLETVYLPSTADFGWETCFYHCSSLKNICVAEGNEAVYLNDGVILRDLGAEVSLYSYPAGKPDAAYTVPAEVTSLGYYAFNGAENLTQVELPENLFTIGNGAFECSGLESVTVPSSVVSIGYFAFANCYALESIYFQGDPISIADNAFVGVQANAYYPADNEYWTEDFLQSYGGELHWLPSDYIVISGDVTQLEGGKTAKLSAKIMPNNPGGQRITWSLAEGDEAYATLKSNGNTATVTAVDVTEVHTITVIAETAREGIAAGSYQLTILPQVKAMKLYQIWWDENEEEQWYELHQEGWYYYTLDEQMKDEGFTMELLAEFHPEGSMTEVTWSSSNTKVATVDESGVAYFTGKPGTTTITATAANGVKASFTQKIIDPISNVEAVGDTQLHLTGGKSATLKIRNADTKKALTGKNVQWSLWMEDDDVSAYASISASGKLTTKKVVEPVAFYVYGEAITEGVPTGYVEYQVILYPATTHIEIYRNDEVVNGQTLDYDTWHTRQINISAMLVPEDAMPVPMKLEISDKYGQYARYRISNVTGDLIISNATGKKGTVTIKITAEDGSKKSASVKIRFGSYATDVEITHTQDTLVSGQSMTLKATALPGALTKPGVTWSLVDPADKAYVKLSGTKLTALDVYEETTVTLKATSKDGHRFATCDVTILPKDPDALLIFDSYSGKNVTKSTVYVDLNEKDRDVYLEARNLADGSDAEVTWTVKGKNVDYSENGGGLWVFLQKAGSVTVTAKSGSRTATVTLKAAKLAQSLEITTKNGKNVVEGSFGQKYIQVASGTSVDLKAILTGGSGKKVTWSITDGSQFAKLTASGKLTANKNILEAQSVTVKAAATDGSGLEEEIEVVVKPLATGIKVYTLEENVEKRTISLYSDSRQTNRSNTNLLWDMESDSGFRLYSIVYPNSSYFDGREAIQDVTWKSSAPKVATVDENGNVTCRTPGTTTITCTAADGSGQKISFKLTVIKRMSGLYLTDTAVAGGKSISLKPIIEPADTTDKALYWEIYGDTAFAKIDQKGKLTTKKVTGIKTVTVYVWSMDGSQLTASCQVTIYPKAVTAVSIFRDGQDVTGKTITLKAGQSIQLTSENTPYQAAQEVTWKSANGEYVSVEDGIVTAEKAGKTVAIICTAADGSGKKATVKIKVVK